MSEEAEGGIYAFESPYLGSAVQVGIASGKVISVSFPATPDDGAADDHPLLNRTRDYLDGISEEDFDDVAVGLTVPSDHRAVLEALRNVPYGESITVETLARMSSGVDPDDGATVRTALAENPVPLFVPDHRVGDGPSAAPPKVEQKLRALEGL